MAEYSFIYLRHGRTEANDKGLCSGAYCESPLTAEGSGQIMMAAEILNQHKIMPGKILLSPTRRTATSAQIFSSHPKYNHLLHVPVEELRERYMGAWEGMSFDAIRDALAAGEIGEGGETKARFHARIQDALYQISLIKDTYPLVVSHGLVWQAIHDLHRTEAPWIENGGLFKVTIQKSSLTSEKIE